MWFSGQIQNFVNDDINTADIAMNGVEGHVDDVSQPPIFDQPQIELSENCVHEMTHVHAKHMGIQQPWY